MDDFEEISEEELAEAQLLAHRLDTGFAAPANGFRDLSEAAEYGSLLRISMKMSLSETARSLGREEVLKVARKTAAKTAPAPHSRAWLAWLPFPAVALLALTYALLEVPEPNAPRASDAQSFASGGSTAPTPLLGGPPAPLLEAQAKLLAARLAGDAPETMRFELAMHEYRGRLITQLEWGPK